MDVKKDFWNSTSLNSLNISSISSVTIKPNVVNDASSMNKKLTFLMQGLNESTELNTSLNKEMYNLFSKLDITKNKFSKETKESLKKLRVIENEDLIDLDKITFRLNLIHKKIVEKKKEREERKLNNVYNKNFKNFTIFNEKLQDLMESIADLECDIQDEFKNTENDTANQAILENKLTGYEKKMEQLNVDIQNMNIEEISVPNILRKSDKYYEKKGELIELDKDLRNYADLPPNLLRAKVALQQKTQEYEEVNKDLVKKMHIV